ncbi:hypothetical protein CKAN_00269400 [Cinnamomum micranthum f. kanehirae]|uniref:Uncharacterized protein n=1 Tax=Cinnamomum micranthum f. kanehirae TaxID=337451 RepID=A0A443N762_9MAGN|nr:hypothetical protein CKAN_00269400 [Cinnamomum micranthum f. kanehirae]
MRFQRLYTRLPKEMARALLYRRWRAKSPSSHRAMDPTPLSFSSAASTAERKLDRILFFNFSTIQCIRDLSAICLLKFLTELKIFRRRDVTGSKRGMGGL